MGQPGGCVCTTPRATAARDVVEFLAAITMHALVGGGKLRVLSFGPSAAAGRLVMTVSPWSCLVNG